MSEQLIIPPGKACGLLKPVHPPGWACGSAADHIQTIPRSDWESILSDPERVRMSRFVWSVFDQDGEGSCASESSTGCFKLVREWAGAPQVEFNPWYNYWFVRGIRGGSSLQDNLRHGRDNGYCPASVWPRSNGVREPSLAARDAAYQYRGDEFYEIRNTEELGSALLKGFPVSFGWQGHSEVAVELIDASTVLCLNSWDQDWGIAPYEGAPFKGFQTLKLKSIDFGYGAYCFRTTTTL